LEEELGISGGDEQEADFVRRVLDNEVGGAGGMLAAFEPLLVCIVSNPSKYSCDRLQTAAALALSKFMLIRYRMELYSGAVGEVSLIL
jgi:hypothetical protein